MHIDTRPLRHRSRRSFLPTLAFAGVLAFGISPSARAQALDDVVEGLLGNQCQNLFPNNFGSRFGDPILGPNLSNICGAPQGLASSSGGGAASSQTSTLSLQNNLLEQRLERAKEKKKQEEAGSAAAPAPLRGRSGSAPPAGSTTSETTETSSASRRFNLFASGTYESVDRKATPFEEAYDSSIYGGAVGFDYQFNDIVVAGLIVGYRAQKGDFSGGGSLDVTAFEPGVYVAVLPSPKTFLQFVVGYGGQNSDVERFTQFSVEVPNQDPDGDPVLVFPNSPGFASSAAGSSVYRGGAQFGYDQAAGRYTFGPRVGVNYNRTTIDPYSETGVTGLELRVAERTVRSFQGVVGFYGSGAFSTKSGVVIPQFNVEYVREFDDEASILSAQFVEDLRGSFATTFTYQTDAPDSGFFNLDAGVNVVFAHGIQMFVNLRTMLGNDIFNSSGGTIGLRFQL